MINFAWKMPAFTLVKDIYWFIFSVINCPKTFIKLSLGNNMLWKISQDERLQRKFIISGTEQRNDYDEYYVNLLTNNGLHGMCIKLMWGNHHIRYSHEYKKNKLDGRSIEYHSDGNLSSITTYKDGYLNGLIPAKIRYLIKLIIDMVNIMVCMNLGILMVSFI